MRILLGKHFSSWNILLVSRDPWAELSRIPYANIWCFQSSICIYIKQFIAVLS
uniref:Uncharacterized protein n=1 Tax=Anguilla anguilla TaxID=7936 RepID=A0A0E9QWI3_ANGAN